jgi:hypothetical protein
VEAGNGVSKDIERVTACTRWGNGFGVIEERKPGRFGGCEREKTHAGIWRVTGSDTVTYEKVACAIRNPLLPFKYGFSQFGAPVFPVCHQPSSLMLKEYRLTLRGILEWHRRSRVVVD